MGSVLGVSFSWPSSQVSFRAVPVYVLLSPRVGPTLERLAARLLMVEVPTSRSSCVHLAVASGDDICHLVLGHIDRRSWRTACSEHLSALSPLPTGEEILP